MMRLYDSPVAPFKRSMTRASAGSLATRGTVAAMRAADGRPGKLRKPTNWRDNFANKRASRLNTLQCVVKSVYNTIQRVMREGKRRHRKKCNKSQLLYAVT